jgi:hypothetical protein
MLLILTEASDTHADAVCGLLDFRQYPYMRLDPAGFPVKLRVSAYIGDVRTEFGLREITSGRGIDLRSVAAIWYRRPGRPAPDPVPGDRAGAGQANHEFLQDLWQSTYCRWVPGTPSALREAGKLHQLVLASRLGFTVPDTLASNDPGDVLDFYNLHAGQVIGKSATSSPETGAGIQARGHAGRVNRYDPSQADVVRSRPMIFQALVPRQLDLRITVVGENVFAADIHSPQTSYRTRYGVHDLPDDVGRLCRLMIRRMRLVFGVIEMIVTPAGEYVFLGINANGQYLWIEEETGLPITPSVADLLTRGRRPEA